MRHDDHATSPDVPSSAGVPTEWPFTGRGDLLARVSTALADSPTLAIVLHGSTGIGKSRAAAESATILEKQAWSVIRLSARTSVSSLPLGGLSPLFAGARPEFGALAADPIALLHLATERIRAIGGTGRILLVVDDLSAMDDLSVAVIAHLVQSRTVKLLATVGEGEPIPDAILALWSESSAQRIDLAPLSSDETAELLARAFGESVARRTAEELHRAAGGNPLFLRELCIGALQAGTLIRESGVWQLQGEPVGTTALNAVIDRRLGALTEAQRDAVERLAICQPLPVKEMHQPGIRTTLSELARMGLVALNESPGLVTASLAQPHYVGVIRAGMSILRIEDILSEQADIAAAGDPSPEDAFRVAVWRLDAGQPASPDLLLDGARLAQLTHNHALAAKLSQAAIDSGASGAAAHLVLADAHRRLGAADAAREAAESASSVDASQPQTETLSVSIASTLALIRHDRPGGIDAALSLLDETGRRHPRYAALVTVTRSMMLFTVERSGAALNEIEPLRAPGAVVPELRGMVAMAAAMPLAGAGRWSESQAEVQLLLTGAPAARDRAFALFTAASSALIGGSLDDARILALEALSESIQFDDEVSTRYAELLLGHVLLQIGSVASASRWLGDAIAGSRTKGPQNLHRVALGTLAVARMAGGDLDGATEILGRIDDDAPEGNFHYRLATALMRARRGERAAAVAQLRADADSYLEGGVLYLATSLLYQAARMGGAAEVTAQLDEIAARGDSPLFAARADHARALATPSTVAFRAAADAWLAIGGLLPAAEALASASSCARMAGDGQAAIALHQRAVELADRCDGADLAALHASAVPDVLTPREREIVDLATLGLTSQEIATRLFLSVRTVDNHLQSSYGKLGIGGRRDLIRSNPA
ncbi:LuxR family transcriptional regulator [Herbiconiux sp.]|uniref:helix-turn-helix transcriptional regulator n=1 Tax=Herbiconiux sp. TaxID=1871186 RepID=UPI0025C63DF7|nr:LuxR family transcriptional regulator [Herbiconiux sp.]